MYSLTLAASIATAACALILLRQFLFIRKWPSAPGPSLAITSRLWYLCKVWQGHFETWNIEQHARRGKILRVAPNWYSIDDVDAMKPIYGMQTKMTKSDWYARWGEPEYPSRDLFTAIDPAYHAQLRRRYVQMYSMTTLRSYEPFVNDCISILLEKMDTLASSGQIFDLQHWMQCYAFDNAGAMTYSVSAGFVGSDEKEVRDIINKIDAAVTFAVHYNIWRFLLPFLLLKFGNFANFIELWQKRLQRIRKQTKTNNAERNAEDFNTKLEALKVKDPKAAEHYRDHILLVVNMTAGSDTTGITLTAIFFYLTKYPKTLEKLRAEIKTARAQGIVSSPITFEESQKLRYLQYVVKESMRMFPGTGLPMWRVVQEPGETLAGTFFPAGAVVGINSWVAHYNESVYGKDARAFRPERWDPAVTPKEQLDRMEQYYLPFGAGTRTCVGRHMAVLQMNKLIPELVMRYDLELISQTMKTKNHWFVKQEDVMVRVKMSESK